MQEIEIEDKEAIIKRNELTLPKINKKAQNTQRIMSHQKVKTTNFAELRQLGMPPPEPSRNLFANL